MKLLLLRSDVIDVVKSIPMINDKNLEFRQQLVQFSPPHILKFRTGLCENVLHHDMEP